MSLTEQEGIEKKVLEAIDHCGIPFEVISCDPDFADTAAFCEKYGIPPDRSANTILVATRKEPKRFALCIVLATTRLDVNHTVRKLLGGAKASFASADDTVRVTGMMLGGVTPFHLPEDLPVYVDARVMEVDYVVVGGGGRSSKIKISPEVFRRIPNTTIVDGLARTPPS
jgi:prolyl-tRNA editing enzyme YbaK/EbsC (Cys-tRNA(Pro) deacylase)